MDYNKLAQVISGIHDTGEIIDHVYKKNKKNMESTAENNQIAVFLYALHLPRLYDDKTQEKKAITIDFPSYEEAMSYALKLINHTYFRQWDNGMITYKSSYYEDAAILEEAVNIFIHNIMSGQYQYALVKDEGKVLDEKRVYNVVRNGDIELVKIIIKYCPSLLKYKQEEIEKLAERDPEVKEMFDKALEDLEQ